MFGSRSAARLIAANRRRLRPRVDLLEGRALLATLTVTSPADSGAGSLRDQIAAAASGDTIDFAPALNNQTIVLTTGPIISVGKNLKITGPGASKLAVSGNKSSAMLVFLQDQTPGSSYIDVTVSGLTLKDGNSQFAGGAIFTGGVNLTLTGDIFTKNHSDSGGGAIEAQGPFGQTTGLPTVNITGTQFLDNNSSAVGGAWESFNVTVNLDGVTALRNSATFFGGGFVASGPDMTVKHSDFRENVGGALRHFPFTFPNTFRFDVSDSTFANNTASNGIFGAAIYNGGGVATYTRCSFVNNSTGDTGFGFPAGGAVANGGDMTMTSCSFVGNHVDANLSASGGALYLGDPGAVTIQDTSFVGNYVSGNFVNGGALYSESFAFRFSAAQLNLTNVSFVNNRATGVTGSFGPGQAIGGAAGINGFPGNVNVTQSSFVGNQAVGGDSGAGQGGAAQGGAFYAFGGFFGGGLGAATFTDVSFVNNTAHGGQGDQGNGIASGGAINNLSSFSGVTLTRGVFTGNRAIGGAGGDGNSLAAGGAIGAFGASMTIDGTAFLANLAQGGDGAAGKAGSIAIGGALNGVQLTLNSGTFVGNMAQGGRGGAAVGATGTGGRGGDAIGGAIDTGNAVINNSTFSANRAVGGQGGSAGALGHGGAGGDGKGGAIALDAGSAGTLTVNDGTFTFNAAVGGAGGAGGTIGTTGQGLGGAIANLGGTAVIKKKAKFVGNFATTSGNDIYGPYTT